MEGLKDFHVFDKRTGEYGTRCDFSEQRVDYEFEGGYAGLEYCIKSDDFIVTPINDQLEKLLQLIIGLKWSDISVLEKFKGEDKYITRENLLAALDNISN